MSAAGCAPAVSATAAAEPPVPKGLARPIFLVIVSAVALSVGKPICRHARMYTKAVQVSSKTSPLASNVGSV